MQRIQVSHGANYLVTDEPIKPNPIALTSDFGITLNPGDKVVQIGKKGRRKFEMKEGYYMIYEGIMLVEGAEYAIFNDPTHNQPSDDLVSKKVQYRFAFSAVFNSEKLQCFLLFTHSFKSCADIQLDYLKLFDK